MTDTVIKIAPDDTRIVPTESVTQVITNSQVTQVRAFAAGSGGGGVSTFTALTDTPGSYVGQAGLTLKVNVGETALEFASDVGEANTGANVGLGSGVFKDKTGVTLNFKSFLAQDNKVTITGGADEITIGIDQTNIDHNLLLNYVANQHIDHTSVILTAGTGLVGGGDISASRTFDLANTAVIPGSYTNADVTVDQQGRLTSVSNGTDNGEANTSSNLGVGQGLASAKVGVDLPFKSLVGGTNITLSSDLNEVTIDGPTLVSEFTNDSGYITGIAWGAITGTLSSQTDLQNALNAKEDDLGNPIANGYLLSSTTLGVRSWVAPPISAVWGNITGTLSNQTDLQTALNAKAQSGDNVSIFVNDAGYTTNAGTVTSIGTGAGLSGGPITATGTIAVDINSEILKATPVAADEILIADSADLFNIKKTTLTDLIDTPAGANYQLQYYDGGAFGASVKFGVDPTNGHFDLRSGASADSVWIGHFVGTAGLTGNRSVLIGDRVGEDGTTGYLNTIAGFQAGQHFTIGRESCGYGAYTLQANITGLQNVAVGVRALSTGTDIDNCVAVGYAAGNNTTVDGCVYIGNQSGNGNLTANALYVANSSTATPLIYGEFDNQFLRIFGDFALGKSLADQGATVGFEVDTAGRIYYANTAGNTAIFNLTGGSGEIIDLRQAGVSRFLLGIEASGNTNAQSSLDFEIITGSSFHNTLTAQADGNTNLSGNLLIGAVEVLRTSNGNLTGTNSVHIGATNNVEADLGTNNLAFGLNAQKNLGGGINSNDNLAWGVNSMQIDDGKYNVGIGSGTLGTALSTGVIRNIGIGHQALTALTSNAVDNTCIGYRSGASLTNQVNDTLMGSGAGENITGGYNTYLGYGAGQNAGGGQFNVYIGRWAGRGATGGASVFIGNRAGENETVSNRLYIDNSSTATPLIYGEFDNNLVTINGDLNATGNFSSLGIDDNATSLAMTINAGGDVLIGKVFQSTTTAGTEYDVSAERLTNINSLSGGTSLFGKCRHATFAGNVGFLATVRSANSAYNFLTTESATEGFSDPEHKLKGDGNGTCDGAWTGGGADRAEFMEWEDGNPENEDRRGFTVVSVGNQKIRKATQVDKDAGLKIFAISSNPDSIGNAAEFKWRGKYLRNEYGAYDLDENGERRPNPDYSEGEYIPRKDRKEWQTVTLSGFTRVRNDQVISNDWIEQSKVNDNITEYLVY